MNAMGCSVLATEFWAQQRCSERNKKFTCEVIVGCRLLHKYVVVSSWRVMSPQLKQKVVPFVQLPHTALVNAERNLGEVSWLHGGADK